MYLHKHVQNYVTLEAALTAIKLQNMLNLILILANEIFKRLHALLYNDGAFLWNLIPLVYDFDADSSSRRWLKQTRS